MRTLDSFPSSSYGVISPVGHCASVRTDRSRYFVNRVNRGGRYRPLIRRSVVFRSISGRITNGRAPIAETIAGKRFPFVIRCVVYSATSLRKTNSPGGPITTPCLTEHLEKTKLTNSNVFVPVAKRTRSVPGAAFCSFSRAK